MLEDLCECTPSERHPPLRERLDLLAAGAGREFADPHDCDLAGRADAQGIGS